ncbi:ABC transporter ATP-binding protein [bacterium]|nr:ABC transporter ATP-binding protein [candidate division CSSED10-310 bacterium]
MSERLLALRNVGKAYRTTHGLVPVLNRVDMEISRGEIVALTGASGVGKSTLLHLMGGLDQVSTGEIVFGDRMLSEMTDLELAGYRNRSVGFVFQFHHLLPEFTALENVAMPLLIRKGGSRNAAYDAAVAILEVVGLSARLRHFPAQLSGGEQQRVALARAMVTSPAMILADEPTGNLDAGTGRIVFEMIRHLNETFGVTFVIATHDLDLARYSHRWLTMVAGGVADAPVIREQ